MNDSTLIELVKEEAENIKKHANEGELNYLSFIRLNSESPTRCIYGQMTGDCFSDRADYLIEKCCSRVYKANWVCGNTDISKSPLNGKPTGNRTNGGDKCKYWSPIEVFISNVENQINGNNETLVKYLRGEIDELNFA